MNRLRIVHILLFLLIISSETFAQTSRIRFESLTVEQGLSQRTIRAITQDSYGFMWFGTHDGLNRFDGYSYTIYRPTQYPNLTSATIYSLVADDDGDLWIGTNHGFCKYIHKTDDIKYIAELPLLEYRWMIKDRNENLWLASDSGLYFFNTDEGIVKSFFANKQDEKSINSNKVEFIFEDSEGSIWIGCDNGVNILNPADSSFSNITDLNNEIDIRQSRITTIQEDANGNYWFGGIYENKGLFLYAPNSEDKSKGDLRRISSDHAYRIIIDKYKRIWVGNGAEGGIKLVHNYSDNTDLHIDSYVNSRFDPKSLTSNTIGAMFIDRWGDLWIGTYGKGINYHSFRTKKFYHEFQTASSFNTLSSNIINCFLEDGDYLWIGTEEGLDRKNLRTGEIVNFTHDPQNASTISSNAIYALTFDRDGNLWIGTWGGGLNLYHPKTRSFTSYTHNPNKAGGISNNNIFDLHTDSQGKIWIGTIGGGLNVFNPRTKSFKYYKHNPSDPGSIGDDFIDCIYETSAGELWVSSYRQLNRFDFATETFKRYTHRNNDSTSLTLGDIEVIFEDSRQHLWIGTIGGLNYYNERKDEFRRFTTNDGLPNNYIKGIAEDDNYNLWISTNRGIAKFKNGALLPDTTVFRQFLFTDGIQGAEFVKRSVYKNSKGYIYFGGTNGYTWFYPDSIEQDTVIPPVYITRFSVFNNLVLPGDSSGILKQNIVGTHNIALSHEESVISFEFTALNYLNPSQNKYAYMMEGFEHNWNYVGTRRHVSYTNLPPGNYTFKVKAANNDGFWNQKGIQISIEIAPPWWQTPWFRLITVVSVVGLLILFYWLRFHNLNERKRILEKTVEERTGELSKLITQLSETNVLLEESKEEVSMQNNELHEHRTNLEKLVAERTLELKKALDRAEEADKLKSSFLANMSHEIRTPMNAIVGFSTLLSDEELEPGERDQYINQIQQNSEALLIIIDDILDLSMIEANQVSITKEIFNASQILEDLHAYYELNNRKPIKLITKTKQDGKDLILYNDKVRFRQVMNNLINNAFKFTEEGTIEISYAISKKWVKFLIADTGQGISKTDRNKIFNQFYKVENQIEKLFRGTGLGLAISKSLVTLMEGKIKLESEPGKGSKFTIRLPYNDEIQ